MANLSILFNLLQYCDQSWFSVLLRASDLGKKGVGEKRKKNYLILTAAAEASPCYQHSELAMYSAITHVLGNNVNINTKVGCSKVIF